MQVAARGEERSRCWRLAGRKRREDDRDLRGVRVLRVRCRRLRETWLATPSPVRKRDYGTSSSVRYCGAAIGGFDGSIHGTALGFVRVREHLRSRGRRSWGAAKPVLSVDVSPAAARRIQPGLSRSKSGSGQQSLARANVRSARRVFAQARAFGARRTNVMNEIFDFFSVSEARPSAVVDLFGAQGVLTFLIRDEDLTPHRSEMGEPCGNPIHRGTSPARPLPVDAKARYELPA